LVRALQPCAFDPERSRSTAKEERMICSEIMKSEIECVAPTDSAEIAARKMRDHNVGFLPVCDRDLQVVGTLTDRDLTLRVVAEGRAASTPVVELMTHEVVSCRSSDNLSRAEELMGLFRVSRMLCVDEDGLLAGVISLSDIAQHETLSRVAQTLRDVTTRETMP
jgi:CBS domain-containing protein